MKESEAKKRCTEDIHCTMIFKDGVNYEYNKCTIYSVIVSSKIGSTVYSKERSICPSKYVDALYNSDFCVRKMLFATT